MARLALAAAVLAVLACSHVGRARLVSQRSLAGCSFEVVTVDDRPLPDTAVKENGKAYWGTSAVLNAAYAERWSYRYTYVHLNTSTMLDYHPTWGKVFYAAERLRHLQGSGRCTWLLVIDSDAYVREFDVPLDVLLEDLGFRHRIRSDVGAVFAQERNPDPDQLGVQMPGLRNFLRNYRPLAPWLNPGVFLVQANDMGRLLLDAWEDAARDADASLKEAWPADKAILTELVFPGTYARARTPRMSARGGLNRTAAVVDMVEMNSPWGRFAVHAWSYHDFFRESVFIDGLVRVQLSRAAAANRQLEHVRRNCLKAWGPDPVMLERSS